jgi:hypothetical protein
MGHLMLGSGLTFFINMCIIILAAVGAKTDLKKEKMFGFYLSSSLLTVIAFIAKDTRLIKPIFEFFSKALVLPISIALILILFFAHGIKLGHTYGKKYYPELVKIIKKRLKELKKRQ